MSKKYSGKQVIKAGEALIKDTIFEDHDLFEQSYETLSYWRFSHETALESCLKKVTFISKKIDKNAIFAKRLKRFISIVLKLRRFPEMKLRNMQDIGGCRIIVSNQKKLEKIVRELKKLPEFKDISGKVKYKNYIQTPKPDGYRSYHLIGKFGKNEEKRNIEVQLRTKIQHDWATTLEIVDLFTGQALKSNRGTENWGEFFKNTSIQFAIMESIPLFDKISLKDKFNTYARKIYSLDSQFLESCEEVQKYELTLHVTKKLRAFANSLKIVDSKIVNDKIDGYILIEVNTEKTTVATTTFKKNENELAEKSYSDAEKKASDRIETVVALVSTDSVGGIKQAYPNYFADSTEFLEYLEIIKSVKTETRKEIGLQLREKMALFMKV